jgi:heptosyltransferase-2
VRGVNWLGDSVMTLPALAAFKRARPGVRVVMGCRPGLEAFWKLCPCVDAVQPLPPGLAGDWSAAAGLHRLAPFRAVVLPNSFRSAWVPFLARVPERVGFPGHGRRFLLTRALHPLSYNGSSHQALDYYVLFGVPPAAVPPVLDGLLRIPAEVLDRMRERLGRAAGTLAAFPAAGPWLAVAPGAARGGSKRWPAAHFAAAAAAAARATGCGVIVCGTPAERPAAEVIRAAAPACTLDWTGETGLDGLAAVFRMCRAVLCNDSGPMHLAAAAGAPVAAVFGLTDPQRTGPLGPGHAVLAPDGAAAGRVDIARELAAADAALRSIRPEAAAEAVIRLLGRAGR